MKIAVLGAGAMGALYGAYLSRENDVTLVDVYAPLVEKINESGLTVHEPDGTSAVYSVKAASDTKGMAPVDLVIVFVKALFSKSALENNRALIGPDTYLLTLQNGSGHEDTLLQFADRAHVVIGTTQHNSAVAGLGEIRHGGSGITHIGGLDGSSAGIEKIAASMNACGLDCDVSENVQKLIWGKLFTNVSASVLTGVLQVPLGYIAENENARALCVQLVREAVACANADGMGFDEQEKIDEVLGVCARSPKGITSICADIANGRKTEVDTISGSVVRAGRRNGTPVPTHEAMVNMVHALEGKGK